MTAVDVQMSKEHTNTHRKTAIIVGVLFIIGTVAATLSIVFTEPLLSEPDYLMKISAHESHIIIGALFVLIMGLALAMVPVLMFPLLKAHHEPLALGYVVFRGGLETVTYLVNVISLLLLIPLSQEYVQAGAPDASSILPLGTLLLTVRDWYNWLGPVLFCGIAALPFYYLLYQSQLIPRFISVWGLIGTALYVTAGVSGMFGLSLSSTIAVVLVLPFAVNEMVIAVWLIVKGFNASAIVSRTAKTDHARKST